MTIPRPLVLATTLAILLAPTVPVHAAREFSRGNITAVDWKVMQIEIRTPQGGLLTYKVAPDCALKFTDKVAEYRNPKLQDLVPPMYIHFVFENQTMYQIDVREVGAVAQPRGQTTDRDRSSSDRDRGSSDRDRAPSDQDPGSSDRDRGSSDRDPGSSDRDRGSSDRDRGSSERDRESSDRDRSDDRQIKVRILRVDERRGTFEADVAGRRQGFRTEDDRLLRDFGEGDLVILSFDGRDGNEVVTDIRRAGQSGRVTQLDERSGNVRIEVRGRVTAYQVEDPRLLRRFRVGDQVTFEAEDRRGQRVITSIQ